MASLRCEDTQTCGHCHRAHYMIRNGNVLSNTTVFDTAVGADTGILHARARELRISGMSRDIAPHLTTEQCALLADIIREKKDMDVFSMDFRQVKEEDAAAILCALEYAPALRRFVYIGLKTSPALIDALLKLMARDDPIACYDGDESAGIYDDLHYGQCTEFQANLYKEMHVANNPVRMESLNKVRRATANPMRPIYQAAMAK